MPRPPAVSRACTDALLRRLIIVAAEANAGGTDEASAVLLLQTIPELLDELAARRAAMDAAERPADVLPFAPRLRAVAAEPQGAA